MNRTLIPALFILATSVACGEVEPPASARVLTPVPLVVGNEVFTLSEISGTLVGVVPGPQEADTEGEAYSDLEASTVRVIHVGEGDLSVFRTPDGNRLLVLSHGPSTDVLSVIDPQATCDGSSPIDLGCATPLEARPLHDLLALSPDGRFALSYISYESATTGNQDVVNLNEVGIYDLLAKTVRFSSIGFNPQAFAFTSSPSDPRAIVLTDTQVIDLHLVTGLFTARELTLGTTTELHPQEVVVTGDDHFALVTVDRSADLFEFDLTQENLPINILSLSEEPAEMRLSSTGDEVVILAASGHGLDVIRPSESDEVKTFALEEYASDLVLPEGGAFALAYGANGSGRYLYVLDLTTDRLTPYLLDSPCYDVRVSPDGGALVLFYSPSYNSSGSSLSSSYAVAILNLAQGDRQPNPILVSGAPELALFVPGLTSDMDRVYVTFDSNTVSGTVLAGFNLNSYDSDTTVVPPSHVSLERMSDGRLVVGHLASTGLLSVIPEWDLERVEFVSGHLAQELL